MHIASIYLLKCICTNLDGEQSEAFIKKQEVKKTRWSNFTDNVGRFFGMKTRSTDSSIDFKSIQEKEEIEPSDYFKFGNYDSFRRKKGNVLTKTDSEKNSSFPGNLSSGSEVYFHSDENRDEGSSESIFSRKVVSERAKSKYYYKDSGKYTDKPSEDTVLSANDKLLQNNEGGCEAAGDFRENHFLQDFNKSEDSSIKIN
ncbi:hypothetical protein H312_03143 [Anncaliia algerae PRA339]|uniref:Uncharacterized protein n=1 Tax=Anncaliia algerae PRA339 TaxID=1288291 RepID=A0A059EXJ0_9MICR|nr:hypothetical protein H312_03143 [Anncaliia algerae PRA339]